MKVTAASSYRVLYKTHCYTQHTVNVWKVDEMDGIKGYHLWKTFSTFDELYSSWRLIHFYTDLPASCSFHVENTNVQWVLKYLQIESPVTCMSQGSRTKYTWTSCMSTVRTTEAWDQIQDLSQMKQFSSKLHITASSHTSWMCALFPHPCYLIHQWLYLLSAVHQTTGLCIIALWRVQVSWDLLLTDQPIELVSLVCQLEDVLIAEGAGTVLVSCAGVDEPGWRGADVRHDRLLHKWAKT